MQKTQQQYDEMIERRDAGNATDEDNRLIRQYEADGYSSERQAFPPTGDGAGGFVAHRNTEDAKIVGVPGSPSQDPDILAANGETASDNAPDTDTDNASDTRADKPARSARGRAAKS
jgi:hypothetical protein